MSHRRNPRKYKGVTRHTKPLLPQPKMRGSRPHDWRLHAALVALRDGGRLVFDKVKQTWYALKATGGKLKLKRGLMLELLKCKFVNFRLVLTGWGRYAAEATL